MKNKKILIFEKRDIIKIGLQQIIKHSLNCEISLEDSYCEETKIKLNNYAKFDIIILGNIDQNIRVIADEIKRLKTQAEILIFVDRLEYPVIINLLLIGVKGFLLENCDDNEIRFAIERLLLKKRYWCQDLFEEMALKAILIESPQNSDDNKNIEQDSPDRKLTKRQKEIVKFLREGKSLFEISGELGITISTISTHKSIIFKKLAVKNLVDLLQLYEST